MDSVYRAGRVIGLLITLQLIGAVVLRVLQAPFFEAGGFLVNVAPHSTEIAFNALLTFAIEALWVGVAVMAFPILYERVPRMALLLVALATVILAAAAAEAASIMSLISVSEAYVKASVAGQEQLQAVKVVVSSTRNGAYTMARLLDGAAAFVLCAALLRLALVPRWLAAFGVVAAPLWIISVLVTVFGYHVVTLLLLPLGVSQAALALWLMAKGFRSSGGLSTRGLA
jgi:hypothetical protein